MKMIWTIVIVLMVGACNAGQGDVYNQPVPNRNDTEAILNVRDHLSPEDRPVWAKIYMAMENPMGMPTTALTVGDAIRRAKAKDACEDTHSKAMDAITAKGMTDIDGYNREVDAYNACLKMPV